MISSSMLVSESGEGGREWACIGPGEMAGDGMVSVGIWEGEGGLSVSLLVVAGGVAAAGASPSCLSSITDILKKSY